MDTHHCVDEPVDSSYSDDRSCDPGNFECNICFELAQDPIVTLCGHLYCWPCLCQWLHVHSHSHECPICKALVQEEKLVPIYGRGKPSSDPRSRLMPAVAVPCHSLRQRPQTATAINVNNFRHNEVDPTRVFMPVDNSRFGGFTLPALFGVIPAFLNLQLNGFHDATVYGATTGVPYLLSSSFHGGYAHGFHHPVQPDSTKFVLKIAFLVIGFFLIISLIS